MTAIHASQMHPTPPATDPWELAEPSEINESRDSSPRPCHLPGTGLFARRLAQRISREEIVRRAQHLPPVPRALLVAHYDAGLSIQDLAALHNSSRQQLYRQLVHWCDLLSDPSFLLASHFASRLPPRSARLARDHWIAGHPLRQLARERKTTVYEIRTQLGEIRVSLQRHATQMRETFAARGGETEGNIWK